MKERVQQLAQQGMTTGEIAVALGWERTPASRRKIRAMLEGHEPASRPKREKKKNEEPRSLPHVRADGYMADEPVQRSTGHRRAIKRMNEAEFILSQFCRYETKFKDDKADFIEAVTKNTDCLSPDALFKLRDMYQRKRKIFDAHKAISYYLEVGQKFAMEYNHWGAGQVIITS